MSLKITCVSLKENLFQLRNEDRSIFTCTCRCDTFHRSAFSRFTCVKCGQDVDQNLIVDPPVSVPVIMPVYCIPIKVVAVPGAKLPEYKTSGAAGADICAFLTEPVVIQPGARALIPTGLSVEIPQGFEIQARPRSGLALKHGVTVLNSPGTIDSDYRGPLGVILVNLGQKDFTVNNGDRIAQLIVSKVERGLFQETGTLSTTERGEGGFGHTGVSEPKA